MIAAKKPELAFAYLDSVFMADKRGIIADSAYYLLGDLREVIPPGSRVERAIEIQKLSNGWERLEKNDYHPSYLHFSSSIEFAKPLLLTLRSKVASIIAERSRMQQEEALQAVNYADEAAESVERNNYVKRGEAEKTLRDSFLNQGLDIDVRVSGARRTTITLKYALMNAVWSYKLNQAGSINTLLELGFKKIILTDGYDYKTTWTRKKK